MKAWNEDEPATHSRSRDEILIGLDMDGDDADDGLEGYDSSQRAEILTATAEGPVEGDMQIAVSPDRQDWA